MPFGVIQLATPTVVMPLSFSRAFTETQTWPARVNEYHDGTSHRSPMLALPRRSWALTKHLPPATLLALRSFWQAQGLASFYFYNPTETVPRFSYDPTGIAKAGRYTVRFASAWSQQTGMGSIDATVQLIEVLPPSLSAAISVFGTGLDLSRQPLAGGAIDPHWTLEAGGPDAAYPGPGMYVDTTRPSVYAVNQPAGQWISNRPQSPLQSCAAGTYYLDQTFSLDSFDPTTAVISGVWAADNRATMYLNGAQAAMSGDLSAVDAFTISTGFVTGTNRIRIAVINTDAPAPNPMGLLVAITSATAVRSA